MSAEQAFRAIARSCFAQLLLNQDCLGETRDAEAVHQMRVALRRLRSAMTLFKGLLETAETDWLRGELRWLLEPLGRARDCDVFLAEVIDPLTARFGSEIGFQRLRDDIMTEGRQAYDAVLALLAQPRLTHLILRLGRWIEAGDWTTGESVDHQARLAMPVEQLALAALTKRERQIHRAMRHLDEQTVETRHQARISIKKLRYYVDFFQTLFQTGKIKRLSAALAVLQDRLGLLNDIAVAEKRLHDRAEGAHDNERLWTAGMIAGWHAARVDGLLIKAMADWRRYSALPHPWRIKKQKKD